MLHGGIGKMHNVFGLHSSSTTRCCCQLNPWFAYANSSQSSCRPADGAKGGVRQLDNASSPSLFMHKMVPLSIASLLLCCAYVNSSALCCRPADGAKWCQEAGQYIQSFTTLNRSQQEAVAKAILRRFTLWQVKLPLILYMMFDYDIVS